MLKWIVLKFFPDIPIEVLHKNENFNKRFIKEIAPLAFLPVIYFIIIILSATNLFPHVESFITWKLSLLMIFPPMIGCFAIYGIVLFQDYHYNILQYLRNQLYEQYHRTDTNTDS